MEGLAISTTRRDGGRSTRFLALLLCAALVALQVLAAPGRSRATGSGALAPSPAVIIALEEFRAIDLPGYFAVSEDGAVSGFAYCRRDGDCGLPAQELAIKFCAEAGDGRPCRIFADAERLLWRGEVVMPQPEDLDLVRRGWRVFATTISWPEGSPAARGWSLMPEGAPVGWVKIYRAEDGGACFGTYAARDMGHGRWQLACSFELTASGTYLREADRWVLEGKSPEGERVRIVTTFR